MSVGSVGVNEWCHNCGRVITLDERAEKVDSATRVVHEKCMIDYRETIRNVGNELGLNRKIEKGRVTSKFDAFFRVILYFALVGMSAYILLNLSKNSEEAYPNLS